MLKIDKVDMTVGGYYCAKCGTNLGFSVAQSYPVPRVPKEKGDRATIDNCVILCENAILK